MDISLAASTLVNPTAKLILEVLASRKRIQLDDAVAICKKQNAQNPENEAQSSLNALKELHLIEEKRGVLPKWNEYYVTADGLEAARKLISR